MSSLSSSFLAVLFSSPRGPVSPAPKSTGLFQPTTSNLSPSPSISGTILPNDGAESVLAEAVEALEREPPRPAAHAVAIGRDAGAKVATAKVLDVGEGHGEGVYGFFFGFFFRLQGWFCVAGVFLEREREKWA